MSVDPNTSLQTLPAEILHRIFDRLDVQTIFFSLHNTCQRLRAVTNSYDRCVLDFESIAKCDFDLICRLIDPRNVLSLTLSDADETLDQVELFLSLFNFRQFTRLRSLILIKIEERNLEAILKNVNTASLTSFSLMIGKYEDRCDNNKTAEIVSSIIAQANLLKLELLDVRWFGIEKVVWPDQSMIQQLRLDTHMTSNDICRILRCLPHLRTLVIHHLFNPSSGETTLQHLSPPFRQVNSLTVESVSTDVDNFELFLSLMPSLTHLRLISYNMFLNGNRWEQFIQTNLPFLINFEFDFTIWQDDQFTLPDIESIIASYRTPFWLEQKRWFTTYEYSIDGRSRIKLSSIPIFLSSITYELESNKMLLPTYSKLLDNDPSQMDNVTTLRLTVSESMPVGTKQQMQTNVSGMFLSMYKDSVPSFAKLSELEEPFC